MASEGGEGVWWCLSCSQHKCIILVCIVQRSPLVWQIWHPIFQRWVLAQVFLPAVQHPMSLFSKECLFPACSSSEGLEASALWFRSAAHRPPQLLSARQCQSVPAVWWPGSAAGCSALTLSGTATVSSPCLQSSLLKLQRRQLRLLSSVPLCLQSFGLAVLMAKAGLAVPAAAPIALPCYGSVLADIGDEQSLSASLSTFSGHLRRIEVSRGVSAGAATTRLRHLD